MTKRAKIVAWTAVVVGVVLQVVARFAAPSRPLTVVGFVVIALGVGVVLAREEEAAEAAASRPDPEPKA